MALDPYVSCPCGSGKKFKWCCAAYFTSVEKAFEQERLGQHEAALATIQGLTAAHPDNPAVWGYFAQFLYNAAGAATSEDAAGKLVERAEEALSEALKRNPNFGMAHFLRGMFRQNEGELIGALMLFRKAADAYDPEATDQLAHVYELIFRNELMLNRPVAARAALERAVKYQPADAEAKAKAIRLLQAGVSLEVEQVLKSSERSDSERRLTALLALLTELNQVLPELEKVESGELAQ